MGGPHQRPPGAAAARLVVLRDRRVRRVRPGSDLRRRAVQRVRAAVLRTARVPVRGGRGGGGLGVLAGEVARRGRQLRRPRPGPAAPGSTRRPHRSRHRLPAPPGQHPAARGHRPEGTAGRPAAPGLPPAVRLRRRGPRGPARPEGRRAAAGGVRPLLLLHPAARARPPAPGHRPRRPVRGAAHRPRRPRQGGRPPRAGPARPRWPVLPEAGRCAAGRPEAVQRVAAHRDPPPRPDARPGRPPLAPGRLPPPGRRGTRLGLRVPAGAGAQALRHGPHLRTDRGRGQQPQDDRQLLHPVLAHRVPARHDARPGDRRRGQARRTARHGGRPSRPDRRHRRRAAVPDGLRPGVRLRALPGRLGPTHRQARGIGARAQPGTDGRRGAARPAPGRRPLRLRRGPQPHGGGAGQGVAVAGGTGAGEASGVPGRACEARQRPDRRDPETAGERHPGRRVQADRGRRQEVRGGTRQAQQDPARRPGRADLRHGDPARQRPLRRRTRQDHHGALRPPGAGPGAGVRLPRPHGVGRVRR